MTEYSKGYKYFGGGVRARHTLNAAYIQNAWRRNRRRQRARNEDMLDEALGLGRYTPYPNDMNRAFPIFMRRRENQRRRWTQNVQEAFGTAPPRARDPNSMWDAPPAAGSGSELMSQRGGTLPGHANIRQRPVSTAEAAAFPANHHSGHLVSNPRRGVGVNTNTMRSISELFQRQTGGNVFYNKLN